MELGQSRIQEKGFRKTYGLQRLAEVGSILDMTRDSSGTSQKSMLLATLTGGYTVDQLSG